MFWAMSSMCRTYSTLLTQVFFSQDRRHCIRDSCQQYLNCLKIKENQRKYLGRGYNVYSPKITGPLVDVKPLGSCEPLGLCPTEDRANVGRTVLRDRTAHRHWAHCFHLDGLCEFYPHPGSAKREQ